MNQETVNLQIPFKTLVEVVAGLSPRDKYRLWLWLDEQVEAAEAAIWEQDETFQAEIQEARAAYSAGDYVTLDEYIQNMDS